VHKPTDLRVAAETVEPRPDEKAAQKPRMSGAPAPLFPPDQNQAPPVTKTRAADPLTYSGSVIGEALQRQQTGRLGLPQPLPEPARPAQPKGLPIRSERATISDSMPLNKPRPLDRTVAQGPASERIEHILPNAIAQQQRMAARDEQVVPRTVSQRRIAEPSEEWFPYPIPVVGQQQALILCVVLCVVIVWGIVYTPLGKPFGFYSGPLTLSEWVNQTIGIGPSNPQPVKRFAASRMQPMLAPVGETSVVQPPSMTADQIDSVLASYGSPAAGSGQDFYNLGVEYGIDPAYALAFFIHESSAGTNAGWAGIKPDGTTTHNIGNIICAGYDTCYNRFRDYPSWSAGIDDWYKLIATEYVNGRGAFTVEQIIPVYAPAFENNVPGYIQAVNALVDGWRQGNR
jgi:hypothetical protein